MKLIHTILLFSLFSASLLAAPLKVDLILPSGKDIERTNQITFKFNQKVVPLGRMERKDSEIPISITPKVKCYWRWINRSTLACQIGSKSPLTLATKYKLRVGPGFKTDKGIKMTKVVSHSFITQRPKVGYISFNTWKSPGTPLLQVSFNQIVKKKIG